MNYLACLKVDIVTIATASFWNCDNILNISYSNLVSRFMTIPSILVNANVHIRLGCFLRMVVSPPKKYRQKSYGSKIHLLTFTV